MKIYKWKWYVVLSRSEERDVAQGAGGGGAKGVFDLHHYSIVLAREKSSVSTKIKHSSS